MSTNSHFPNKNTILSPQSLDDKITPDPTQIQVITCHNTTY